MLRTYFLQQWFNLSDPAVEEALYDLATLRQFAGIDLGAEPVPDETTVCKFRHRMEEHNLGEEILGTRRRRPGGATSLVLQEQGGLGFNFRWKVRVTGQFREVSGGGLLIPSRQVNCLANGLSQTNVDARKYCTCG
jgi:hypothetical protein